MNPTPGLAVTPAPLTQTGTPGCPRMPADQDFPVHSHAATSTVRWEAAFWECGTSSSAFQSGSQTPALQTETQPADPTCCDPSGVDPGLGHEVRGCRFAHPRNPRPSPVRPRRGRSRRASLATATLSESGTVPPPKLASLLDECHQLLAILTTISKRAKSNARKPPP